MTRQEAWQALRRNAPVGIRYLASAALSFTLNLLLLWLFHRVAGWTERVSFAASQTSLFVLNFWVARLFIFRSTQVALLPQLRSYVLVSASFRLAEYALFLLLQSTVRINYLLCASIALGTLFVVKFLVYHSAVFPSRARAEGSSVP